MLYDAYQKKINKIAKLLAAVIRMLPLIIAIVSVLLATGTALLITTGMISEFQCTAELTYGGLPECSAKAFLSDVRYEYREGSDGEWQEGLPKLPGTYSVRAVTKNAFGKDRYSKEQTVLIFPKALGLRTETEMEYGETPKLVADGLVGNDRIVCEAFIRAPLADGTSADTENIHAVAVTPDVGAVSVFDENGNDITSAYLLQPEQTTVFVTKRNLTVQMEDFSKIYDGTPLSSDRYGITGGSLLPGDTLSFTLLHSQTDAGETENLPEIVFEILDYDGIGRKRRMEETDR